MNTKYGNVLVAALAAIANNDNTASSKDIDCKAGKKLVEDYNSKLDAMIDNARQRKQETTNPKE
ncbi:MAG: hypothetical protein JNL32_04865 [Candidatus Kapabacteria bacterium]|nr:hypothetical protein [Candidatus Kapabacteria bacterium]